MRQCLQFFVVIVFGLLTTACPAAEQPSASDPAAFVRALTSAADHMTFAELQLAIDKAIDPAADLAKARSELDDVEEILRRMLRTIPADAAATSAGKIEVLRDFLYRSGWWNQHRPFQYDMNDPFGQKLHTKLLTGYLDTRKGNCVSMPTLFLVLGERLGLNVTLSTAPLHVFVKWMDDATDKTFNLEATSGAGFTRDSYYRERMPMTDEAIANGVYLKTLTRRETVAVMATTVLEHLLETKRYHDAIAVADALLEAYPAHAYVLAKKGTAYYRLLAENFIQKYPKESDIPADELPYAIALSRANLEAFAKAEALGWREPELNND